MRAMTPIARASACLSLVFSISACGVAPGATVTTQIAEVPSVRQSPMAVLERADRKAVAGDFAGALTDYAWCLKHGEEDRSFGAIMSIPGALAALGSQHPPALELLRAERDELESAILSGRPREWEGFQMYAEINRALGEASRSITTFDNLPSNGWGELTRKGLFMSIVKDLYEGRRYKDVVRYDVLVLSKLDYTIWQRVVDEFRGPSDLLVLPDIFLLYGALIHVGRKESAAALADVVVGLAPPALEELVEVAQEAGAVDEVERLKSKLVKPDDPCSDGRAAAGP